MGLSSCLQNIDQLTTKMDYNYVNCLHKTSTGADVIACMNNVKNNTNSLIQAITEHPSCANLNCFQDGSSRKHKNSRDITYQECLTADNVKVDKFTDYLKLINKKTSNLTIDYLNCLHQSHDEKGYKKCLGNIANLMDDFKQYLNTFCQRVTSRQAKTTKSQKKDRDINNKIDSILANLCQVYQRELVNILGECGYPQNLLSQQLTSNVGTCRQNIPHLVGLVSSCLEDKDDNITNHIVSKLADLHLTLDNLYEKKARKLVKNTTQSRGGVKQDGIIGSVAWKQKCLPWKPCWIKESGYDPQKDVHNIYYGFFDACQTALHPLANSWPFGSCDPSKPVYSAPPPAGF